MITVITIDNTHIPPFHSTPMSEQNMLDKNPMQSATITKSMIKFKNVNMQPSIIVLFFKFAAKVLYQTLKTWE